MWLKVYIWDSAYRYRVLLTPVLSFFEGSANTIKEKLRRIVLRLYFLFSNFINTKFIFQNIKPSKTHLRLSRSKMINGMIYIVTRYIQLMYTAMYSGLVLNSVVVSVGLDSIFIRSCVLLLSLLVKPSLAFFTFCKFDWCLLNLPQHTYIGHRC